MVDQVVSVETDVPLIVIVTFCNRGYHKVNAAPRTKPVDTEVDCHLLISVPKLLRRRHTHSQLPLPLLSLHLQCLHRIAQPLLFRS